ncbi:MAG TPA: hypothetical protein VGK94_02795 [Candidatus Polarisedimenticolia bacterium]|jgi:hypothetical protein
MRRISLAFLLLLTISGAGPILAGEARFYLAPYGFASRLTGDAQVSDGTTGTEFNLEDTLGVEPRENILGLDGFVKILGSRIGFGYSEGDHAGDAVLDQTVTFNGQTYTSGDRVHTEIDFKRYRLMYGYDFSLKVVNFGILVGLHGIDVDARLESEISGLREGKNLRGVIPAVGATLGIHPISKLAIHAEASGLALTISGVKVKLIDGFAGVDWLFVPKFGVKAGYRYFVLDAQDDDEQDSLNLRQTGPFAGIALHL